MSTGKCFTSSSFIPMQDCCGDTNRKSKDNERKAEKGRGYIRSIVFYFGILRAINIYCNVKEFMFFFSFRYVKQHV